MERHFILMIVVMLVGLTIHKKNRQETDFNLTRRMERNTVAAIGTCAGNSDYADVLMHTTEQIYETATYKNSVQRIIKNSRRPANKLSGSTNPRSLFNILRSLPMGEPYYIQ